MTTKLLRRNRIVIVDSDFRETMKFVHVNPEEAIKMHQDLKSKLSFGIHWGTFKLTLEPYMEPKEKTLELVAQNQELTPFLVPNIAETVDPQEIDYVA